MVKKKFEDQKLDATSFLSCYYGISKTGIEHMDHQTLAVFFPQLKRTSFDYMKKNLELLYTGQILLVEDAKHYLVPYLNPNSSMNDVGLFCNNSELAVQKIVESILEAIKNHTKVLFIIEGKKSLDEYLYLPETISTDLLTSDAIPEMRTATLHNTGIIIKNDYSLRGYKVLNHGDNCGSTVILSPLQRQAVGISRKTDAGAVLYEKDRVYVVVNGQLQLIESELQLRKFLMQMFSVEVDKTIGKNMTNPPEVGERCHYIFSDMPKYELEKLMEAYRMSKQMPYYYAIRRELTKRKKQSREFHFDKTNPEIKQKKKKLRKDDYYDKY